VENSAFTNYALHLGVPRFSLPIPYTAAILKPTSSTAAKLQLDDSRKQIKAQGRTPLVEHWQ